MWIESWENWTQAQNFVWIPLPATPACFKFASLAVFFRQRWKTESLWAKQTLIHKNKSSSSWRVADEFKRSRLKQRMQTTMSNHQKLIVLSLRRDLHNCLFSAGLLVSGYITQRVEILPFHVRPIPSWRHTTTSRRLRLYPRQRWGSDKDFIIF